MQISRIQYYTQRRDTFIRSRNSFVKAVQKNCLVQVFRVHGYPCVPFLPYRIRHINRSTSCYSFLGMFLSLVKLHIAAEKQKRRYGILAKICKDELKALAFDFSSFEGGNEFTNASHNYSYDLDIFGDGSVFQFLNRTSTYSGKKVLSQWLKKPTIDKEAIEEKQLAVKENCSLARLEDAIPCLGQNV